MKKKILTFLFAICLILPCAFIMTACGGNPPPDNPPPPTVNGVTINGTDEYIWLTPAEAMSYDTDTAEVTDGNYAIWLADFYDKNTLEITFDEDALELNSCVDSDSYNNRRIGLDIRKIATFSIPTNVTGEHELNINVEEEVLNIKFVTNDQEFTAEELEILDNYHLTELGGRSFKEMMLNEYPFSTTYSQITTLPFNGAGITFTGDKRVGYYVSHQIVKAVDQSIQVHNNYHKQANHYYSYSFVIHSDSGYNGFNGFEDSNILLTFDKENLKVNEFFTNGTNNTNAIFSYKVGETEIESWYGYSWSPADEEDINFYINQYDNGVDLSNVEAYVNDTKMEIKLDGDKKYFTIPAGALPVEYCEDNGEMFDFISQARTFNIDIRNVIITQESQLYTQLSATSNSNKVVGNASAEVDYENEDGVIYYMPNTDTFAYYIFNDTVENATLTVKGHQIDLDYYLVTHSDIPDMSEEWTDIYQTTTQDGTYYHYVLTFNDEVIVIDVAFDLNDSSFAEYINVWFIATGPTTVSLTCE